jgi:hypothetical protein
MTRAEGHFRAGDDDRERTIALLKQAQAEGRLDLDEFDDRVRRAWAARTFGELDELTTDLPEPVESRTPVPAQRRIAGPVVAWAAVVGINLVIWLGVSLANGAWAYPWWIWVAGPWGVGLLIRHFTRPRP